MNPNDIYLNHVKRVAKYVKSASKGKVRPIIWDDMLRTIPFDELKEANLGELIDPMIWVYVEDIDHFVDEKTWNAYSKLFTNVWSASAFKGAFGERLFMPNLFRHYLNHLSWLEIMSHESKNVNFQGIALTGWSRYDHFAVLCELLPVAVPSLILNLVTVSSSLNESERFRHTANILNCSRSSNFHFDSASLQTDPHQLDLRRCNFPGNLHFSLSIIWNRRKIVFDLWGKVVKNLLTGYENERFRE